MILTNCPNCGRALEFGQQFCRSCGAAVTANDARFIGRTAFIGILFAFGGIIVALTGKMIVHQELLVFIGVVLSIAGMASIAITPLLSNRRSKASRQMPAAQPATVAPAEPTFKLPPIDSIHEIPSVVENTTELLKDPIGRL